MKLSLVTLRNIFLGLFIIATLSAFGYAYREASIVSEIPSSDGPLAPGTPELVVQMEVDRIVPIITSIVTSLTTLLGFVLTSILTLRKEKRDSRESDLALKQKEIELKRALIELEDLKKRTSG